MTQQVLLDAISLVGGAVVVALLAVYLWPLRKRSLRRSSAAHVPYAEAVSSFAAIEAEEAADPTIQPEGHSILLIHGTVTSKAVVMLHGYTACPDQFRALAKSFYDNGYNVYIPRAPHHGLTDKRAHAQVTAAELITYAEHAVNLTSGLGDEVGVMGISGGGVLASWSALYRSDVVRRALILAPFYEPAPSQAAKWKLKPLEVLYGFSLLPDIFNDAGYSYHALAQYLIIARNLKGAPQPNLLTASLVVADGDTSVDHDQASRFMTLLSSHPTLYTPPASWKLTHNIVDGREIGSHAKELYGTYLRLYEGVSIKR